MASTTRTLTTNFVGRTKNLEKSFKRVAKGSSLMSDKLMRATRMAGIGFSALGGVAVGAAMALKPMIDKASDVQESLSKNNVVFGESARAVEQFAERSLQAYGVTRREALEATGVIGTLGAAMGMAESDSADMATTLVGLAGDMASFNNASIEETLTAIQSGLRGENEPLRRFGVLLDAATLKAKALEKGIIKSTKEALTPQAKALAAYALILEQTEVQMGDFERTSDGAANQQRLLAGAWDDLQVQIGEKLLPAFTRLVTWANNELVPAFQKIVDFDWSELTFEDLEDALVEAEKELIKVTAKIGVNIGESILDGMKSSWEKDTEEGGLLLAFGQKLRGLAVGLGGPLGALLDNVMEEWLGDNLFPTGEAPSGFTLDPGQRGFGAGASAGAGDGAAGPPLARKLDAAQAAADAIADVLADVLEKAAAVGDALDIDKGDGGGLKDVLDDAAEVGGNAAGDAAGGISDAERTAIMEWLGTTGAQAMLNGPPGTPQTVININAAEASPQEIVDRLGKFVQDNGPLSRQWIDQ